MTDTTPASIPNTLARKHLFDLARLKYRARKQFEKKHAAKLLSPHGRKLWSAYLDMAVRAPNSAAETVQSCILAHVYYPELLPEIVALAANFPGRVDLHITTRAEIAATIRAALAHHPAATVHVFENRGRDVAPALALLGQGVLDRYDAVLKVHTKRSPHALTGNLRRQLSYQFLAGHAKQVLRIQRLFAQSATGIVGWKYLFHDNPFYWHETEDCVRDLCRRMGLVPGVAPLFFEGTMFWFRPSALAALRSLNLQAADFETEPTALTGCLHHAIERSFVFAALAGGFQVLSDRGRVLAKP